MAEVAGWAVGLEEVHARIAGRFARAEPRARVLAYLRGLLGQLERKNGWTLAEAAGGLLPGTDPATVNLAAVVSDGEQISVGVPAGAGGSEAAPGGAASGGRVNLNTAGARSPAISAAMIARPDISKRALH